MEGTVDPRKDFYTYSVGEWLKTHPVPPDKPVFNAFYELRDWNMERLHMIVDDCNAGKAAPAGSYARMVGDFYGSAMDTKLIDAARFAPIDDLWQSVAGVKTQGDIMRLLPQLHMAGVGALFNVYSDADQKNSATYALYFRQGGLTLPDREYYLSDTFAQVRADYKEHVAKMFILKGIAEPQARNWAETVLGIETEMAKSSRSRTDLRDSEKNYNMMETAQLDSRYATLSLNAYMKDIGVPPTQYAVVGQPEFLDALNGQLSSRSVDDWKVYLYWKTLHSFASKLHREVDDENFDMFGRKLMGQQQPEPRWKRAISTIDSEIGEALGKIYVDGYFDQTASRKANELVGDIIAVMRDRLETLPWMTEDTRRQAVAKLDSLNVKIGHPAAFRDYTGLTVMVDDYVGNIRRAEEFELRRQTARVGQQVDRNEWLMTPQTVNAYYEPTRNEIVFPAGILQPPFFDAKMDTAVNYGGIGAVIGHEITHGFDDQGRLYDASGNLKNWWKPEDEREFKARASTVIREYSEQEALPKMFINGDMTQGENIADMGGLSIAYEALQRRLKKDPQLAQTIDGLTPDQRFFISFAQVWRQSITEQELKRRLTIDEHSPAKYRATIPVINHPEFDRAFPQQTGTDTVPPRGEKVGVW